MKEFVFIQTFSSTLHSTKIHFCTAISTVRRSNFSPCMCMISNYNFYFIVVNRFSSFWTAENRSYRNHQMKLIIIGPSRPKENQNTVEKNEFYEWEIWRTIMRTMNENSFICIKINSWFQYDRISSAFFFIKRFFLSITFFRSSFISTAGPFFWSDQIKRGFRQHSFLSSISYRSTFQQLILRNQRELRQHFVLSLIHTGQHLIS